MVVPLPPTFTGGSSYHMMNYQDAMSTCRVYGPADLHVTFIRNTRWKEISGVLRFEPRQQLSDHSELVFRVFCMKVDEFITDIKEGNTFDHVPAVLCTVEFKKCGVAHVHCLVWLATADSEFNASPRPQKAPPNELQEYIGVRYLSTCEALWLLKKDFPHSMPASRRIQLLLGGDDSAGATTEPRMLGMTVKVVLLVLLLNLRLGEGDT